MDINRNNYETFFLLYLDRELGPEEMMGVEKFLTENTDLKKEFALLQQTVQFPADIIFEQKESLFHPEEKRRIVPFYWIRTAAAIVILILGSWLIRTRLLKNNSGAVAGIVQPAKVKQHPAVDVTENKGVNQIREVVSEKKLNPDQNNSAKSRPVQLQVKSQPVLNARKKPESPNANPDQRHPNTTEVANDTKQLVQKSGTNLEFQSVVGPTDDHTAKISALPGVKTGALLVSANGNENQINGVNTVSKEPDNQTDDAISVVALNDHNKPVTDFFKKLVRRPPADENTRKVRVSVFQISY